ncbi:MAG: DUF2330 domain-containing protein [Patescibacteria group bacterium]|nr:DUF2330 domain-containing protein [Patescibacteria group bacterium]
MFKKGILLFSIFGLLLPSLVLGDGMIMPPPHKYMYETGQKAIVWYENGIEKLILSTSFQGDADDFSWIIPTPNRPKVTKSSDELFTSLDELTRVELDYDNIRPMSGSFGMEKVLRNQVRIIETKKIEYYDVTVLTSEDKDALARWLNKNGYQFPSKQSYILDSYIKNRWYFTAVKIDASKIYPGIKNQLKDGHIIPLQLSFKTNKAVYPLKISSIVNESPSSYYPINNDLKINPDNPQMPPQILMHRVVVPPPMPIPSDIPILIYVFTKDKKQHIPGFNTDYAGWVDKSTISNLGYDDNGLSLLEAKNSKYYLTKLSRNMSYAEMTSDLFLRDAKDQSTVNAPDVDKAERNQMGFYILIVISLFFTIILSVSLIYYFLKH